MNYLSEFNKKRFIMNFIYLEFIILNYYANYIITITHFFVKLNSSNAYLLAKL